MWIQHGEGGGDAGKVHLDSLALGEDDNITDIPNFKLDSSRERKRQRKNAVYQKQQT